MAKNKHNSTKTALLFSVLSMVLCIAMLVGSTFAWFTDTATAGVNTIQSGKLLVDIQDASGASLDGKTLKFTDVDGNTDNILWEPGCTYNLPAFKIVNTGNLAFKYKVTINGATSGQELLRVIGFTVKVGTADPKPLADWGGVLLPADATPINPAEEEVKQTELITISGHMQEDASNDYQGIKLEGIGITVIATQYTYESDSNDNLYDENISWEEAFPTKVGSADELANVLTSENLQAGKTAYVQLTEPITSTYTGAYDSTNALSVPANTALNLDLGETTFKIESSSGKNGIMVEPGAKATFSNGTIEMNKTYGSTYSVVEAKENEVILDHVTVNNVTKEGVTVSSSSNGILTIKDSTIIGVEAIYTGAVYCASQATIVIENSKIVGTIVAMSNSKIELKGGDYREAKFSVEKKNIIVYAGTFSVNPKTAGCTIAADCTVTDNGDGTWTVA